MGIWPKSIEVQLFKGNAGDLWVIGTDLDVHNEAARKEGRRHKNLTDGSEKPIGEWNRMEITCKGDTLRVKVNGDLVNEATHCTVSQGAYIPGVRRGADRVPEHRADAAEEVTTEFRRVDTSAQDRRPQDSGTTFADGSACESA